MNAPGWVPEKRMRYWFDTEFQDDGSHLVLISVGVVAEDGREYYAVSSDYEPGGATDWLSQHVLPQLGEVERKPRERIRKDLQDFFSAGAPPEFWADCGEYDWIILRQLFGTLTDWPEGWPYLAMDIEQWRIQSGAPPFPVQTGGRHNALSDARHTRYCWQWLAAWTNDKSPC